MKSKWWSAYWLFFPIDLLGWLLDKPIQWLANAGEWMYRKLER